MLVSSGHRRTRVGRRGCRCRETGPPRHPGRRRDVATCGWRDAGLDGDRALLTVGAGMGGRQRGRCGSRGAVGRRRRGHGRDAGPNGAQRAVALAGSTGSGRLVGVDSGELACVRPDEHAAASDGSGCRVLRPTSGCGAQWSSGGRVCGARTVRHRVDEFTRSRRLPRGSIAAGESRSGRGVSGSALLGAMGGRSSRCRIGRDAHSGAQGLTSRFQGFVENAEGAWTETVEGEQLGLALVGDLVEPGDTDRGECPNRRGRDLRKVSIWHHDSIAQTPSQAWMVRRHNPGVRTRTSMPGARSGRPPWERSGPQVGRGRFRSARAAPGFHRDARPVHVVLGSGPRHALRVPRAADQFVNAAAAARFGAGLALQPGEVDAAAVRSAVASLLADSGFATATRRVGEEIAAMPTPVDVGDALHERVGSA